MTSWDQKVDMVVVGSGAAGMTAALTAKLEGLNSIVLEKCDVYGGSTAISGGGIWIPNNHLMTDAGIDDSKEKALTYLENTVGDRSPRASQEAFVTRAPEMIRYLSKLPHMEFKIVPGFSDYYPERPGGMTGGRGLESPIFCGKKLGDIYNQIRIRPIEVPFDTIVTIGEGRTLSLARAYPPFLLGAAKVLVRNLVNKISGTKHISMGGAIIARFRMSLLEQDVPVWLNTAVKDIIFENGSAIGVEVDREGKKIRIHASKGIVLAAGGFPHNKNMREKYQQHPVNTDWTIASPGNTGEVIDIGINAGAATDLMDDTWGVPTILPPGEHPFPLVMERACAGSIMVNSAGKRYTNESASYVDVVHAMYDANCESESTIPSFFIMDKRYLNRYVLCGNFPGFFPKKHLKNGFVVQAPTVDALAEILGIDPTNLVETVERFNGFARSGKDPDFGRGDSAYDRFYSAPSVKPNSCMAPVEKPPFYAVKVFPGDLGTKGGLVTNEKAQVINEDGEVIEGLYAAGNTSASVMGNTYPGPGGTIGPAMTFGYIAAKHAAAG